MKLSIVIICWNDLKVIMNCLNTIFSTTKRSDFEVIVSDNGSSDGSLAEIRSRFPLVKIVENGANLGFAKGNNAGIQRASGEYVLILNPDTLIHPHCLDSLLSYADEHREAGAFGCRVLNPDGSYQHPARPLPTLAGLLIAALNVRWLAAISKAFDSDVYYHWDGRSERRIGYQSGCCLLVKREILQKLGGFDERFFYHFEETDLCKRIWDLGLSILYFPQAEITHLGGQSVGRFPIRFALETYRSEYRYFYKHFGKKGVIRLRKLILLHLWVRRLGYGLLRAYKQNEALDNRLKMYSVALKWNSELEPLNFVRTGAEPDLGYEPLAPAPKMTEDEGTLLARA